MEECGPSESKLSLLDRETFMRGTPFLDIRLTFSQIVGSKKKECSNRGNIVCCGAIHGDIGTQCKDVEDEQITCPEPALAYRKHKRWSLPLKRALFHKRADFCDQRAVRQAPKPIDNTFGFPAFTDIGGAVNFIHELSKSDDKGTKSYPGSTTTFDPAAPVDFLPEFPANNQLDYTSDPYAQQNFKAWKRKARFKIIRAEGRQIVLLSWFDRTAALSLTSAIAVLPFLSPPFFFPPHVWKGRIDFLGIEHGQLASERDGGVSFFCNMHIWAPRRGGRWGGGRWIVYIQPVY